MSKVSMAVLHDIEGAEGRISGWTGGSVRRQLLLAIVGAPLVLAAIFFFDVLYRQNEFHTEQGIERAKGLAHTLAINSVGRKLDLAEVPQSLAGYPGLEVAAILSPIGVILAHSDPSRVADLPGERVLTAIRQIQGNQPIVLRDDLSVHVVSPITSEDKLVGWAQIVLSTQDLATNTKESLQVGLVYVIFVLGVGLSYGLYLTGAITRGLRSMVDIADTLRKGDRHARIDVSRRDEIGQLGNAINALANTIEQREHELQNHKNNLESLIAERTADLTGEIAERERIQAELAKNEERVRLLINSAGDGIVSTDQDGKIVLFNSAAEKLFGYSVMEVTGKNVNMLIPPAVAHKHDEHIAQFSNDDSAYTMADGRRIFGQTKDGRLIPVEISISTMHFGEEKAFTAIVRDVSARVESEIRLNATMRDLRDSRNRLSEKEAELRNLLESSPVGVSIIGKEFGERIYANSRFLDMFGAESIDELEAFGYANTFVSDDDAMRARAHFESGSGPDQSIIHRRKINGEEWWSLVCATPLEIKGKRTFIVWCNDITDQKKAETVIQESENRLRKILDNSPVGIAVLRVGTGKRIYTNNRFLEMFGVSSREELEEYPYDHTFVTKDEADTARRYIQTGDGFKRFTLQRKKVTGESWWGLHDAVPVHFMGGPSIIVWHMDITEQKTVEKELQENEHRLRQLLESSPSGISVRSIETGKPLYANSRFLEMFGVKSYEEMDTFGVKNTYVSERDWQSVTDAIQAREAFGRIVTQRLKVTGEKWWSLLDGVPIQFEGEQSIIIWHLDVTDQKQAETELVRTEKMASLGGLVAGVAHEVNTPIGVSVTAASHLQEKTTEIGDLFAHGQMKKSALIEFLDTAQQSSDIITSNLQRAAELVRSFKQVAVDRSSDEKRSFLLLEYLREVQQSLNPQFKRKPNVSVSITGDEAMQMESYPGPIAQVLTNLMQNTLIHGFPADASGEISVSATKEGDTAHVVYQDTGKGIPQENLRKIFDPFFTTNRSAGGSGLGMHITYNLVTQKLGGTIDCQSAPGEGVRFDIHIPLRLGEES